LRAQARAIRQAFRDYDVGFLEWRFLDRLLMCSLEVGKRSAVIPRRQHIADAEYIDRSNLHDIIKRLHQANVIEIEDDSCYQITAPSEWKLAKRQGPERAAIAEKAAQALDQFNEVQMLLSLIPPTLNQTLRAQEFYHVAQAPQVVGSETTRAATAIPPFVVQIPQDVARIPQAVGASTAAQASLKASRPSWKTPSFKLREGFESLKDALAAIESNDEVAAMKGMTSLLGREVMEPSEQNPLGDGGKWRTRWRTMRGKTHRVMAAIVEQLSNSTADRIKKPGGYAEDLWKRFAS